MDYFPLYIFVFVAENAYVYPLSSLEVVAIYYPLATTPSCMFGGFFLFGFVKEFFCISGQQDRIDVACSLQLHSLLIS